MGWNILHHLMIPGFTECQMTALELKTLRNAAMTLSEQERAALARDLVASLDSPPEDNVAEAWDREICRRIQQIESGEAELLDPKEVLSRARARIGG
jgi:putative addiction module component (TIGR02574 family)